MKRALLSASPSNRIVTFSLYTDNNHDGTITVGLLGRMELLFMASIDSHPAMEKLVFSSRIDGIWGFECANAPGVLVKFNTPLDIGDLQVTENVRPEIVAAFDRLLEYRLDAPIDQDIPDLTDDGKTWVFVGQRKMKPEFYFKRTIIVGRHYQFASFS